jgi:hypothetical protein
LFSVGLKLRYYSEAFKSDMRRRPASVAGSVDSDREMSLHVFEDH